ncbi:MAG: alanine--glyoxylate aminotransferase family protein, partial [Pleurocapsa sp.]
RTTMREKYDIALAGGQDHLKGKIFRVGHLGFISDRDVIMTIGCLEAALTELGHDFEPKSGTKAAAAALV